MISSRTFVRFRRRLLGTRTGYLREYPKLFVVGSPRSGTTWVTQMLCAHPNVITNRESHAFPFVYSVLENVDWNGPGLRDAMKQRYLTQQETRVGIPNYVSLRDFLSLIDDTLQWAHGQPTCSDDHFGNRVVQEVFDRYFFNRGGTGSDVFLEKSPSHSLHADRILRAFPNCKILHVLRDGRDVCVSMQMRSLTADWSPKERSRQIDMWVAYVSTVKNLAESPEFEGRIHTIRYEDLHQDTEGGLTSLLGFAGLDCTSSFVEQIVDRTSFKTKSKTGPGKHSYKGIVGEWSRCFSDDDIRLYTSKAGEVHRACGYELEARAA